MRGRKITGNTGHLMREGGEPCVIQTDIGAETPLHRMGDNAFRMRNRLKAACEDHEAGRMTDDELATYVRRTVLAFTDDRVREGR